MHKSIEGNEEVIELSCELEDRERMFQIKIGYDIFFDKYYYRRWLPLEDHKEDISISELEDVEEQYKKIMNIDMETVIIDAINKTSSKGQTIKTKYQEAVELIRDVGAIAEKEQIEGQSQVTFDLNHSIKTDKWKPEER